MGTVTAVLLELLMILTTTQVGNQWSNIIKYNLRKNFYIQVPILIENQNISTKLYNNSENKMYILIKILVLMLIVDVTVSFRIYRSLEMTLEVKTRFLIC